ncbi:hypothetical protein [Rhodococcus sp. NPDC060176]|uniref:hypothetical protein n=1 Tax=Rhodococcus sp. NPDC060176 TaxID=3347062 RepID=UPI00366257A7
MTQDHQTVVGNTSAEPCALLWPPQWGTEKPNLLARYWVPAMVLISGALFIGLGVATVAAPVSLAGVWIALLAVPMLMTPRRRPASAVSVNVRRVWVSPSTGQVSDSGRPDDDSVAGIVVPMIESVAAQTYLVLGRMFLVPVFLFTGAFWTMSGYGGSFLGPFYLVLAVISVVLIVPKAVRALCGFALRSNDPLLVLTEDGLWVDNGSVRMFYPWDNIEAVFPEKTRGYLSASIRPRPDTTPRMIKSRRWSLGEFVDKRDVLAIPVAAYDIDPVLLLAVISRTVYWPQTRSQLGFGYTITDLGNPLVRNVTVIGTEGGFVCTSDRGDFTLVQGSRAAAVLGEVLRHPTPVDLVLDERREVIDFLLGGAPFNTDRITPQR